MAVQLDDILAHAARQRWSPRQLLEQLTCIESADRAHRSLERRLRASEIKKVKPMADFEWSWPTRIEPDVIERALTLGFLAEARNLVLVGANGLQKHARQLIQKIRFQMSSNTLCPWRVSTSTQMGHNCRRTLFGIPSGLAARAPTPAAKGSRSSGPTLLDLFQ